MIDSLVSGSVGVVLTPSISVMPNLLLQVKIMGLLVDLSYGNGTVLAAMAGPAVPALAGPAPTGGLPTGGLTGGLPAPTGILSTGLVAAQLTTLLTALPAVIAKLGTSLSTLLIPGIMLEITNFFKLTLV